MNLGSGDVQELPFNGDEVSEIVWVGPTNTSVLYLNGTGDVPGGVSLWMADLAQPSATG